jgi:hypothetical protein
MSSSTFVRPTDNSSPAVALELRAAMGGEDAALFCAELARAYLRLAERRGWPAELLEGDGRRGVVGWSNKGAGRHWSDLRSKKGRARQATRGDAQ